jgi:hypothetical protein
MCSGQSVMVYMEEVLEEEWLKELCGFAWLGRVSIVPAAFSSAALTGTARPRRKTVAGDGITLQRGPGSAMVKRTPPATWTSFSHVQTSEKSRESVPSLCFIS